MGGDAQELVFHLIDFEEFLLFLYQRMLKADNPFSDFYPGVKLQKVHRFFNIFINAGGKSFQ